MNRRDLIRAGAALVGSSPLAGCTAQRLEDAEHPPPFLEPLSRADVDLPFPQRLAVAAERIDRAADAEVRDAEGFAAYLDDRGIRLETIESEARPLTIEYVSRPEAGLMRSLGDVAGGYAALIEGGHDGDELAAHLLDPAGAEFGEYEIRREWAERYAAGEYTAKKYADEIAVTVATT